MSGSLRTDLFLSNWRTHMADRNNNKNATWRSRAWHVILGCTPVSEGCRYCFAALMCHRQSCSAAQRVYRGLTRETLANGYVFTGKTLYRPEKLIEPYHWRSMLVWVGSMSDPFHPNFTLEQIAHLYAVAADNPQNKFQFLTKRIEWMQGLYTNGFLRGTVEEILRRHIDWPLRNTWEGTSAEDERTAKTRLPVLLDTPSHFRFVSFQPLLDGINVTPYLKKGGIQYAVIGAEAGPASRPFNPNHIVDLQVQLHHARVPSITECYPL